MKSLEELSEETGEDLLGLDGYDDCIAGIVTRFGQPPLVCYDRRKIIDKLIAEGLDEEQAEEHFSYNMIGAWAGDRTPCFIEPCEIAPRRSAPPS